MDEIVEHLRGVGFTLYEARLYATLLRYGPQNGNELSRKSGVPSSKVYATAEKMMAEGTVKTITSRGGARFVALDPAQLVSRLRRRFNEPLDFLAENLPALTATVPDEAFMSVVGTVGVLAAARQLIDGARNDVSMSIWEPEVDELRPSLAEAARRKVRVFGMLYSPAGELPAGTWQRHSYEDIVGHRIGGRLLSLVADGSEVLVARLPEQGEALGVQTRNSVLTLIVSEYLHHDVVLQRAQVNIGFDEWDKWWQADPELRAEILGRAFANAVGNGDEASKPRRRTAHNR
jgi:sugar-specific transcriptional regulator TrmB